jgi:RsiW-degrading membrane proteinase PrsW (M82 family)
MAYLLALLLPTLAILYWYYNKDRHREPWQMVALVFTAGALSVLIAFPLERAAQMLRPTVREPISGLALLLECLLIPGLIEESVKLLVVLAVVFWRRAFNEPIDGLVYGTAAALGFAFAEDCRYYFVEGADWRRVFSAITHPWFSCFWAASLGWAKLRPARTGVPLVIAGLVAAAIVHGVYDFLILISDTDSKLTWLRHLLAPLLFTLYVLQERRLERACAHQEQQLPPASVEPEATTAAPS